MRRFLAGLLFLVFIAGISSLGTRANAVQPGKIKVLIVDGFSNHDWKQTTELIRGILEPTGLFDVHVSTSPPTNKSPGWDTWRPKFADHDVVIQTCNDINIGTTWPREVQIDFERFVAGGGGFFDFHSANNAFPKWAEYNEMIGLAWRDKNFGTAIWIDEGGKLVRVPAGEGEGTGHGPQANVVINVLGSHPIHAGMPKKWQTPHLEVYYYARGPAKDLEVLSYGFDPRTRKNWPTEWVVNYGKGRVYNATFGHVWKGDVQPESMRCVGVQTTMVRALQWLAKREVDFPLPVEFPTEMAISLRPRIPYPASEPTK